MDSPFDEEPPEKGKDFASDEASTIRQRKQCIDRLSASLKHQYEVLGFDDHFTLRQPSAGVTFRGESVYVYELNSSQVQLRVSQKDACAESKDTQDSFKIEKDGRMVADARFYSRACTRSPQPCQHLCSLHRRDNVTLEPENCQHGSCRFIIRVL